MKARIFFIILLFMSMGASAQVVENDSIDNDSIVFSTELEELVIGDGLSVEEKKQLLLLRRRVLKVYPYAKLAAEKLTMMANNMDRLKTDREKKKYAKIVEKYLEDEFEGQLKKLTRKEGQILVKLIYRQTGHTTFDLIKEHKSGWKAFWSNRMARLFDINLKMKYNPANVTEDYAIEGYLLKAFDEKRLVRQEPAFTIDYDAITENWRERNK
ncbi:DUF4294 domain-containing protein [Flavobacterium sp. MFBS3-15]|uniref:DUF4294 domain-containing protein n=1 Tax=Flavobacterium sp. MFBS3-15 TaxID=2989816 RepID=UPI0022368069|nr:DUF4294 domain-containing protein [Flavobacterium sp. MFBS3-15]MCW4469630.1 DUF4294 domain-containing protein [Flavobacterium sp. MFBS3-15]